ncbi:Inner membrane component of T3SS domain-containing protein [Bryocella elongata]|uniref:Inner membrane component of T3SS domain-containing protein n=1 Tax=Bryocella elongata TaxID=863522 RepID=A0A1H6ADR7_9BACT|nr:DUF4123 domain-containing protein [Bryocella elongata]SEG46512.1 Inner membrane component of T3SS domain-containing protein [Bryocella elongata]
MKLELIVLEGPQVGRRVTLTDQPLVIGRAPDAPLPFPADSFMSGHHLSVQTAGVGVLLIDLQSTNGTKLNGQSIAQAMAFVGDIVKLGGLTLQVVPALPRVEGAMSLELQVPVTRSFSDSGKTSVVRPVQAVRSPQLSDSARREQRAALSPTSVLVRSLCRRPLYCLLDAGASEVIPALLALAPENHESLYDGEAAETMAQWAPYLVELPPDGPLLDVLVRQGWGKGWASYFTSAAPFEELRQHFRRFLLAQLEGGNEISFRFYDPRVLREFLPSTSAQELRIFFGAVFSWLVEAESHGTVLEMKLTDDSLETTPHTISTP